MKRWAIGVLAGSLGALLLACAALLGLDDVDYRPSALPEGGALSEAGPRDAAADADAGANAGDGACAVLFARRFGPGAATTAPLGVARGVSVTPGGAILITGTLAQDTSFDGERVQAQGSDAVLVTLSPQGVVSKALVVGDPGGQDGVLGLENQSKTYWGGDFQGTLAIGDAGLDAGITYSGFLARMEPAGTSMVGLFSTAIMLVKGMSPFPGDGVFAVGDFRGAPSIPPGFTATDYSNRGQTTVWIARAFTATAPQILLGSTGGGAAVASSVATVGSSVAVTGRFTTNVGFDGKSVTAVALDDAYLAKLDSNLRSTWVRSFSGAGEEEGIAVAAYSSDVALTGTFTTQLIEADASPTDVFTHTFVALVAGGDGGVSWVRTLGSYNGNNLPAAIATDPNAGRVYVAGSFQGSRLALGGDAGLSNAALGTKDVFLVWFDAAGAPVGGVRFGDALDQRITGLAVDGDRNLVLFGEFAGQLDLGCTSLTANGPNDWFVVKLAPPP